MRFKIFSIFLVIIFGLQSWIKADDIKDFEIEGMSIGDSALEYFNEKEIKQNIKINYFSRIKDKTFVTAEIRNNKFENYDALQIILKRNDNTYKIYGMHGIIFYKKNINLCYKKLSEISKEIEKNIRYELKDVFENLDMGGKRGKYSGTTFILEFGIISVHCYDWSKEIEKKNKWTDNLRVNIKTDEYENFLQLD
tara:strand:- start:152 stop:736 length:585 start_codon:yes stop_codon:yes gene_type:complete